MVYHLMLNLFNLGPWGGVSAVLIIIIIFLFGVRTYYLFQLYGCRRFFLRISNLLYLITFVFGLTAVILTILHFMIDIFLNKKLTEIHSEFLSLYKPMLRERICVATIALFSASATLKVLFSWYLSPNLDVVQRTLHYSLSIISAVLVIFFCFGLILYQYFPDLIENPTFAAYTVALTYGFNFRQLSDNMILSDSRLLPLLMCIISSLAYFVVRLCIIFFYAIARYNRHYNLFHIMNRRKLSSLIIDTTYAKMKCLTKQELAAYFKEIPDHDLDSYTIQKMKESALKYLESIKEKNDLQ